MIGSTRVNKFLFWLIDLDGEEIEMNHAKLTLFGRKYGLKINAK